MSTTLLNAEVELSKQLGDHWASTTTSNGASDGTTLVDTALKAKANDWVETGEAYDMITEEPASNADIYEERQIDSLDNTTGTLTVLAHGGHLRSGHPHGLGHRHGHSRSWARNNLRKERTIKH